MEGTLKGIFETMHNTSHNPILYSRPKSYLQCTQLNPE